MALAPCRSRRIRHCAGSGSRTSSRNRRRSLSSNQDSPHLWNRYSLSTGCCAPAHLIADSPRLTDARDADPAATSFAMDERQTIICLFCGKPQEVARRAMSITCKFCHKSLKLEDIAIKQYEARRQIVTCGVVTVEKKGSAVAE